MENPAEMTMSLLAFYWPYGVDVLATFHNGITRRGQLVSMTLGKDLVHIRRDWAEGRGTISVALAGCRLVLREFKDLLTPLPDETIPAVELAKIYFGRRLPETYTVTTTFYEAEPAGPGDEGGPAQIRVRLRGENSCQDFYIRADWWWHGGPDDKEAPASRINLIAYLWWRHFAFQMDPAWYVPMSEQAAQPGQCQVAGCVCCCHLPD